MADLLAAFFIASSFFLAGYVIGGHVRYHEGFEEAKRIWDDSGESGEGSTVWRK